MANDGGPAFPLAYTETNAHGVEFPFTHPGMTLRDWFAGQAMAAIVGKLPVCGANSAGHVPAIKLNTQDVVAAEVARGAFNYADAMLAALASSSKEAG